MASRRTAEQTRDRRAFAAQTYADIRMALNNLERAMWKEAAETAKAAGVYAASTYHDDVRTGLLSHLGIRRGGIVNEFIPESP